MANIMRLCNGLNTELLKPLLKSTFRNGFIKFPAEKSKFGNRWYHFTRRKLQTDTREPLSIYIKIGVGVVTGIGVKLLRNNSVYCLQKTGSRVHNNETKAKDPDFNWSKFIKLLQSYWLELLGAVLAAMVCALLNIQIPRALGNLVDVISKLSVSETDFMTDMKKPAINMITYYTLQSIFTFFYIALLAHVGEGIAKTMKVQMFSSIMNQDMAFFDTHRSGELLNRELSFRAKEQASKVTLTAEEAISNIRTVRSFAMEELENKILNEQAEICKQLNIHLGYGIALFQAGTNLFLNGMVLSTIYIGGYMMTTGSISAGDLMAFLVAVQMLQRSFTQVSLLFGTYIKGKHAGARVFEIIDLPSGKTLSAGRKIPYHSLLPNIEFKNVAFSYPSRPDKEVLKNINLYIPEGKTIAIVGSSGSGKSTLAWLLERFYDVDSGVVLVGEEDIRNLDSTWLRKNVIGFISQEPVLFATSVLENIRYGKPTATDEEVVQAAKLANADNFIRGFPDGYSTMVGERGVSVSGGQKQRIAIARALLKNPSILILDEATSALDSESEKAVQHSLEELTKFRTTIIIAHRLSTIKNVDLIVVLHNGVIVESGTHRELLAKKGMYAALVANQVELV
ncbi:hypothetical protein RUM43_004117 [Polyplax serrata]|uniref:Mitochondrial potassium channel ATP-binding subunit n=1 Tax=Polyplax serrata TaxID=468196 RepID=A0AAN8SAJ7_POLSC